MILSFHPCFQADKNIICAGRKPAAQDLAAIRAANAVILPQGCSRFLYQLARDHCRHVFPNYDVRFEYPGKIGQIHLVREVNAFHPKTETFRTIVSFQNQYGSPPEQYPMGLPFVFKFDWGGEGETVYFVQSKDDFFAILDKAEAYEKTGQTGFLIQEYVPHDNRTLRVVIIGQRFVSYWRIQQNPEHFHASLSKGAVIDVKTEPKLQQSAVESVENFCLKTDINLAGFDVIFSTKDKYARPLFLEINYFFGRKGLGGSQAYYEMLNQEIRWWLGQIGLSL